jgi:hypothetical protein
MAGKIDWSLNVIVAGGPKFAVSDTLQVDAYDTIDVTIPKKGDPGAGAVKVSVQPGGEGTVQFLFIKSSLYDDKLTYAVDGGSPVKLDAPQLLTGDGLVSLLNKTQKEFVFKNDVDPPKAAAAAVQILVGRNAGA